MRIIITGSNGFIAKHLRDALHSEHELVCISRNSSNDSLGIDLSNPELVSEQLKSLPLKADVLIHTAAVLATSNNTIDIFYENNRITHSTILLAQASGVKKVINLSTIGVYPNESGSYNESSIIHPSINSECMYGLSKFCSEELLSFSLGNNTEVINLRLAQTYGKGMRDDRIYSIMLKELKEKNTITVWGDGERSSCFIDIDNVVNVIRKLIYVSAKGVFNLGEKNITYKELAEMLIAQFGNSSSKIICQKEGLRSKVVIDFSRITTLLS